MIEFQRGKEKKNNCNFFYCCDNRHFHDFIVAEVEINCLEFDEQKQYN
jgi:hypothetical protein